MSSELFKPEMMSSSALSSESKIDMSSKDNNEEEMEKTPHHNITVVLKEVKSTSISKQLKTHFFLSWRVKFFDERLFILIEHILHFCEILFFPQSRNSNARTFRMISEHNLY